MKYSIVFTAICMIGFANPLQAISCMAVALHDTYAIQDQDAVWKSGKTDGPVTEYDVDNRTGVASFCIHGGYCYLAYVSIDGRAVQALRLTNCRVKQGSGTNYGKETDYELEAIPAQAPVRPAAPARSTQVKVNGWCGTESHTVDGEPDGDLTMGHIPFQCDTATIYFLDGQSDHLLVKFSDSLRPDGWVLEYSGFLHHDGQMLDVTSFYYRQASNPIPVSDSTCKFFFDGDHIKGIFCGANFSTRSRKSVGVVAFNADPGQ